ncbi:MAG: glycoside hydrolase family 44 protein, partial [Polyangia bacterium]
ACTPSCANKTCGSDGCNGTCGGCPPTQMCGASGSCQTPSGSGITVDTTSQLTPISPDIYGVAFATATGDDSYKVATLDRWGGDAETSYNWQKDLHNSGGDWMCANYTGGGTGNSSDTFVQTNKTWGIDTLMTIPITGWLANVATSTDTTYSSLLGQDLSFCNYPQLADGGLLTSSTCCQAIGAQESTLVDKGSNHLDTSFMGNWVTHLVSTFGSAASGGVKYYQLDNEPDNWQGLRQDIYPSLYPPGTNCMDYSVAIASGNEAGASPNEDIMNRSVAYATAIKTADPTAQVLFLSVMNPDDTINLMQTECGVGSWGSATVPYTATNSYAMAMLARGKQYESTNQQRIFDCLDTHYPGTAQAMWTNTFSKFQGWIDSSYPGTATCISEYNVANDTSDPTTTSQEADYLGTFGVMGVRLAAYWTTLTHTDSSSNSLVHNYTYNAFAMFRNYDGAGSTFGNVSVGAASSYSGVHAYAATDSATSPSKLWLMLVNTGTTAQSSMTIAIKGFTPAATAQVYQSTGGAAPAAGTSVTIGNGQISGVSIAANTVMLIALTH